MRRLSDRAIEIAFGASLLGIVLCTALAGELALTVRSQAVETGFDWDHFLDTVSETSGEAQPRFRPGAVYEHVAFNTLGFRGPELDVPKPEDRIRVAFLGNSVFLGAEHPLEETIPHGVVEQLAEWTPGCRFDYVNISGPRFAPAHLASLLAARKVEIEADVYVAMGSTVRDLLEAYDVRDASIDGLVRQADPWSKHSRLWRYISHRYGTEHQERAAQRDPLFPQMNPAQLRETLTLFTKSLHAEIDDQPVIVIRANGQLRDAMPKIERQKLLRPLLAELPRAGVDDIMAIRALIDSATSAEAELRAWTYVDPIGELPPTYDYFSDSTHPSAKGNAQIAQSIASEVATMIKADLSLCQ